jgi:hypothetical protein
MKTETSSLCLCVALTALHHNKQNSNNDGQSRYDSEMGYEKNWTSYGRIHFLKQLLNIGYQSLLRYIPNLTSSTPYRVLPMHKPTQRRLLLIEFCFKFHPSFRFPERRRKEMCLHNHVRFDLRLILWFFSDGF